MSEIDDRIATLLNKVESFTTQILAKLKRKAPTAGVSDDADKLNGQTATQMQTTVDNAMAAHAARVDNPHGITPAILEAYTDKQLTDLTDPLLRVGVLPVSQFGALSSAALTMSYSGFNIVFGNANPILLWGKSYNLPAQTVDITAQVADPGNKTLFVYVTVTANVPRYQVLETYASETANRLYIGKVTTNANAILSSDIAKVTKLDTYRLSTVPKGGAIPMTIGRPTATATLDAAWKP